MMGIVAFTELGNANLIVDAVYESSEDGQLAGEPISKLLPVSGNMRGFRDSGRGERKSWVVLFSTGEDRDWPDSLIKHYDALILRAQVACSAYIEKTKVLDKFENIVNGI